jgi:hypothetical protein
MRSVAIPICVAGLCPAAGADLYATSSANDQVASYFRISTIDASVEPLATNPDFFAMHELALGPDAHHYGINAYTLSFDIVDPTTGVSQMLYCLCAQKIAYGSLTVTPEGHAYMDVGINDRILGIDIYTGDWLESIYIDEPNFGALQWRDDGRLIGASQTSVYEIDIDAEQATLIGALNPEIGVILSFARERETGLTYMLAHSNGGLRSLYLFDPFTADAEHIGDLPPELDIIGIAGVPPCDADFNGDEAANVLDFVAFQLAWQSKDPSADCDASGTFDVIDFVCFSYVYSLGCN